MQYAAVTAACVALWLAVLHSRSHEKQCCLPYAQIECRAVAGKLAFSAAAAAAAAPETHVRPLSWLAGVAPQAS
jgi:hypothetical protein